jgi:hypothetical protein
MTRDPGRTGRRSAATFSSVLAPVSAGLGALLLVVAALAQDVQPAQPGPPQAPPPSEPAPPPAAMAPGPSFQPGFIDAFGRLLEQGAAKLKSDMQGAQENFDKLGKEARDAAKDATSGFVGLPGARVVSGRELCATAQNGAPDCVAAAAAVCRGKGFQTGKSLDTQSEQKCPARLLLSGRPPNDTDCASEIYVTRAMCQ